MEKITFTSKSYKDANIENSKQHLRLITPNNNGYEESDSFEFVDCPIDDRETMFEKIGKLLSKKTTKNTLTTAQAFDKACINQCEAIKKRKLAQELIKYGASKGYRSITGLNGNRISFDFEKDPIGRGLMLEWNDYNKVERMTVFIPDTGEISRIEEKQPNSRKYNRFSYFNCSCNDIEIKKGITKTKLYTCVNPSYLSESIDDIYVLTADIKADELYKYKEGRATSLKKDCKSTQNGTIAKEEYYF